MQARATTLQTAAEERRPFSAYVDSSGVVEEANTAVGARLVRANSLLVEWAQNFLETASASVQFWYWAQNGWHRASFDRSESTGSESKTFVTVVPGRLPFGLTRRELDVLTLMAGGLSNPAIASRLVTSVRTIATHVERILMKTGTANRAAVAALAAEQGILCLPIPGREPALESLTVGLIDAKLPSSARIHRAVGSRAPHLRLAKRPLTIGSAFPLTGPAAGDGREMRNGSALAIDEINRHGGIAGRPIRQVVVDIDIFSPGGVTRAFTELIDADVDAITTGYVFAEDIARELAAEYGAPYLHATTSESEVQRVMDNPVRYGNIFQVCPSEAHYGRGFIRFLDEIETAAQWRPPNRRLVFIETPLQSGQMTNAATVESAERAGWTIERCEVIPAVGADWRSVVAMLGRIDAAAIMIAQVLPGELAAFQRSFASDPAETLVYAIYAPSVPEFLDMSGDAAEGLVWSTVTGTYSDPTGFGFNGRYAKAFGRSPGRSHAGIAYDEVHLLAQGWAVVGNSRDFRAVAQQLRRTIFRGVNGVYSLGHDGQCGLSYPDVTRDPSQGQAHLVFQVQDGQHRILSPTPYAEALFRPPARVSA